MERRLLRAADIAVSGQRAGGYGDGAVVLTHRDGLRRDDGIGHGQRTAIHNNRCSGAAEVAVFRTVAVGQCRYGKRALVDGHVACHLVGILDGQVACALLGQRGLTDDAAVAGECIVLLAIGEHEAGGRHILADDDSRLLSIVAEGHLIARHEEVLRAVGQEEVLRLGEIPDAISRAVPCHLGGLAQGRDTEINLAVLIDELGLHAIDAFEHDVLNAALYLGCIHQQIFAFGQSRLRLNLKHRCRVLRAVLPIFLLDGQHIGLHAVGLCT